MGVGLQPLEFTECLADSPHFRENLQRHEKELERTSHQIKRLIKEVKDVVQAAKRLGAAQLALATSMEQFEFACIGASMTEDERVISHSLQHFAHLIRTIEDERDRMLGRAHEQIIQPLEKFRKEHIGAVKEGKKKFDKKTAKFCQSQERTLSLSTKKQENVFQEADAALEMAERDFCQASLEYVFQLQAVQEREKFELVETLLGFVFGWWTFHHTAHDVHHDAEPLVRDLQLRIQRTRSNFEETSKQTESLMKKMMEMRQTHREDAPEDGGRRGYLFLMEKKAFGTTWSKHYCGYERASRVLSLMPYNQINPKSCGAADAVAVAGARAADAALERRFCWDAVPADGDRAPLTLQALGDRDRARWMRALDTLPPAAPPARPPLAAHEPAWGLDDAGFAFARRLIAALEARGLDEQGLYRVAGVASKVARLVALGRAGRLPAALAPLEWESRTLTSALKAYLRALPEPLLTWRLHGRWLAAAKCESRAERARSLATLVRALPPPNREMLRLLLAHLRRVAARSALNLMGACNLAVCFGPTLLRAERETVASILELKFYNVLVEALIEDAPDLPDSPDPSESPRSPDSPARNGAAPDTSSPGAMSSYARNDIMAGAGVYSPQHLQLLQQLGRVASSESVSSCGGPRSGASRVRTLYACLGESDGELSFEPNQIITDVVPSGEPGWLRGSLDGKSGLVPENYVEPLP
ncbi:rho GTPase-activating protein Graf [Pieris napi]|uniref:rho GTPase-activating protein Graf n=1 Tax=Pieris napi TaxID=78633 RepID=UPI001FBB0886|nr:rho GTPase-activating protein Graf [Pieris napi]